MLLWRRGLGRGLIVSVMKQYANISYLYPPMESQPILILVLKSRRSDNESDKDDNTDGNGGDGTWARG